MSILSRFIQYKRNKDADETPKTKETGRKELEVGSILKVFARGKPLLVGTVCEAGPTAVTIDIQSAHPALDMCKSGDDVLATSLDDSSRYIFMIQGRAVLSSKDLFRIDDAVITKFENQRTSSRIQVDAPVFFGRNDDDEDEGRVANISTGGIFLMSKNIYREGEDMRFNICLESEVPMTFPGYITRMENHGDDWYRYGVCFHDLSRWDSSNLAQSLRSIRSGGKPLRSVRSRDVHYTTAREILSELSDNMKEARRKYPEGAEDIDGFMKYLDQAVRNRYPRTRLGGNVLVDDEPKPFLYISGDHMTAYVCVLPPVTGEKEMDRKKIRDELSRKGILSEVPMDVIQELEYLQVAPLLRGIPAVDGVDGSFTELFKRLPRFELQPYWKSDPDFSEDAMPQAVHRGETICRIQLPVYGKEGMDVMGRIIPCRQASYPELPIGAYVEISANGNELVAGVDGLLYFEDGKYNIQPQRVVSGGLNTSNSTATINGMLKTTGDLFVIGDVYDGVQVEAVGSIIISGYLRDARVTSKTGSVRVQGGICGLEGQTFVTAVGQIEAKEILRAQLETMGSVVTNNMVNSEVKCGDTVRVIGGEGVIAGSIIYAKRQIACRRIDGARRKCCFSLGCDPNTAANLADVQKALSQAKATQEILWKNTSQLRASMSRLSKEQKQLLDQLLEQRDLYKYRIEELRQSRDELQKMLRMNDDVHIYCEELEPLLEVQICDQTDRFTQRSRKCHIHLKDGWITDK